MKGNKNNVVNALSRKPVACSLMEVSIDWNDHLLVEYSKKKFACELMDGHIQDDTYRVVDDNILYKDMIYLVSESHLKEKIMRVTHDTPLAEQLGYFKTYSKIKERHSLGRASRAMCCDM